MALIQRSVEEINEQMNRAVEKLVTSDRTRTKEVVRMEVERYYNGKLLSKKVAEVYPEQIIMHLDEALRQKDCTVYEEEGCLFKVVREEAGAPLKFIARCYDVQPAADENNIIPISRGRRGGEV